MPIQTCQPWPGSSACPAPGLSSLGFARPDRHTNSAPGFVGSVAQSHLPLVGAKLCQGNGNSLALAGPALAWTQPGLVWFDPSQSGVVWPGLQLGTARAQPGRRPGPTNFAEPCHGRPINQSSTCTTEVDLEMLTPGEEPPTLTNHHAVAQHEIVDVRFSGEPQLPYLRTITKHHVSL